MKKIILIASAMTLTSALMAQKQTWYVGGTAGFSSSTNKMKSTGVSYDATKMTSWSFSPEVGTFLTNNWQLGIGLTIGGTKQDLNDTPSTTYKSTNYGGTVYTRYFFGSSAFRPFLGANVQVLPGTSSTSGQYESKYNTLQWGVNANAGFGYSISKKVSVLGSLGFLGFTQQTNKLKGSDYKTTNNTFGFNVNTLNNPFTIGMYFTL